VSPRAGVKRWQRQNKYGYFRDPFEFVVSSYELRSVPSVGVLGSWAPYRMGTSGSEPQNKGIGAWAEKSPLSCSSV